MSPINVASDACLPGPVDQMWVMFEEAGFPVEYLPDEFGWMPTAPVSGHVVGRVGIRNRFGEMIVAITERDAPYTNQQVLNMMLEVGVWQRCDWLVSSVPFIPEPLLEALAEEAATSKPRRNIRVRPTDPSSGSNF